MKNLLGLAVGVIGLLLFGCRPFNPQSQVRTGEEALAHGDLIKARFHLEKAARLLPGDARCQNLYGQSLYLFGDLTGATEAFRKAIDLDRNNPDYHYNLALTAYTQRNYPIAIEQFQTCLGLTPRNLSAWLFLGATYMNVDNLDAAYKCAHNVLSVEPANPDALNNLAVIAYRRGRTQEADRSRIRDAETWLNQVIQASPNYAPAHLNLARLCELELKDKRRALDQYRMYSALVPDSPLRFAVLRSTRELELDLNLPPSAPLLVNSLQPPTNSITTPPIPPVLTASTNAIPAATATNAVPVISAVDQQVAKMQGMIDQLKSAGHNRDAAEVTLALGDFLQQQHEPARAAAAFGQAAELDPLNSLTHFRLGVVFQQQGQKPAALQSFQEAARLNPDFLAALRNVAPLAIELGQPEVAEAAYQRIIEIDPNDPLPLFKLADLQEHQLKNRPAAEQLYQAFLKKFPNAPEAAVVKSRLAKPAAPTRETAKSAKPAAAKPAAPKQEVTAAAPVAPVAPAGPPPDTRTAAEHYKAGLALLRQNAYDQSIPEFEAVLRRNPTADQIAQTHLGLGQAYSMRPETMEKAKAHYLQFLQMRPDDPQAASVRQWFATLR